MWGWWRSKEQSTYKGVLKMGSMLNRELYDLCFFEIGFEWMMNWNEIIWNDLWKNDLELEWNEMVYETILFEMMWNL